MNYITSKEVSILDKKVLEKLESADWGVIIDKLTYFAINKVNFHTKAGKTHVFPRGFSIEDIVGEAIKLVWNKERKWNPDKYPDLLIYLKTVIKSIISHLFETSEYSEVSKAADIGDDITVPDTGELNDPESVVISNDQINSLKRKILDHTDGDDDLTKIVNAIFEGFEKSREISEYTGIDIEKVYKKREKLRQIVSKIDFCN